jgi:hypothetical protein
LDYIFAIVDTVVKGVLKKKKLFGLKFRSQTPKNQAEQDLSYPSLQIRHGQRLKLGYVDIGDDDDDDGKVGVKLLSCHCSFLISGEPCIASIIP